MRRLISLRFNLHFRSKSTLKPPPLPPQEPIKDDDPPYKDLPLQPHLRKPFKTPLPLLIRRHRRHPPSPDNGLLHPHLLPLSHSLYASYLSLLRSLPSLHPLLHRCLLCSSLHVGLHPHLIRTCPSSPSALHRWSPTEPIHALRLPDSYHLFDRASHPRVTHTARAHPRAPAVVELCVQAGLDLEEYPTRRRTRPVYSVGGRAVDFEGELEPQPKPVTEAELGVGVGGPQASLDWWLAMRAGAEALMEVYKVWTCGYCEEVQVGPKGHNVRRCRARGHQFRAGLHAWQEATVDDVVPPNYVWHVRAENARRPMVHELRRFYGMAPAVVELCVQAGAAAPREFVSMMRSDVVAPERDEFDLVA
ncbi:hypothetical protein QJS04_geneDACA021787 [Acorus gramineus]|uniref:APO domain-containing protein n=1 Tax=Acorus gramineus TaxID=55184 RepID=A0AAV9A688_ACOGR|nr:hypothetical protein QJS04_geneDACA021787 [Acorus gramineus]